MNKTSITLAILLSAAVGLLAGVWQAEKDSLGGGFVRPYIYQTASSTVLSPGHQESIAALERASNRRYASICNHTGGNTAYLSFGSSAITATTSADVIVPTNTCFELDSDNLYVGAVQIMSDVSTSSNSVLVTELRGSF